MEPSLQTSQRASAEPAKRTKWIICHATLRAMCFLASFATVIVAIYGSVRYHAAQQFIGAFVAV